jgi:4Fe-4S single cluster domain
MNLGLMLTNRCNATCAHCTTQSGPHKKTALGLSKTLSLIDEAAALTPPGHSPFFGFSGGELFLDLEQLLEVIRHGASLNAEMSCVTNAFWATTEDRTNSIIGKLRQAGLKYLAVSTSQYHQRFISITRVRRATLAARAAGIQTLLKIAFSVEDEKQGLVSQWGEFVEADAVQAIPVVPYIREGVTLPDHSYVRSIGLPAGKCPSPMLTVREDGAVFSCCSSGAFKPMLQVGSVSESPLKVIADRFNFGAVQRVLRERGPIHFAQRALAQGQGGRLRPGYANECDLCAHIASDAALTRCALDSAQAYRVGWALRLTNSMKMATVKGTQARESPHKRTMRDKS